MSLIVLFVEVVSTFYPEKITEHLVLPRNAETPESPSAAGTDASFVCGCFVRFLLEIDSGDKRIASATFQTNGCGYMIAAADVLCEQMKGQELTELHGSPTTETSQQIQSVLGEFPGHRSHCLETCISAIHSAFAHYRAHIIEEFRGEKALVCTCFGISEETIEKCVAENRPETATEVADLCKAGSGCGSCRMIIEEMIDLARIENI